MRLCMIHQYTSITYKCLKVHASYFSFFFCITIGANGVLSVQALFCGLGLGWTTTTVVVTVRSRLIVWWDQAVAPLPFFPSVCFWPRVVLPSMKFARPGRIHRRDEAFVWIPSGVCGACGIVPRNCDIGQRGGLYGISTISIPLKWLRFSGFFLVHGCTVSEWMKCVCYRRCLGLFIACGWIFGSFVDKLF